MQIYTIGFTKRSAEDFFETLNNTGASRLIDVRLNNTSQLSGFTKKMDLNYFLRRICGMEYIHEPLLAPTAEMLSDYQRNKDWRVYSLLFLDILSRREVEKRLPQTLFAERSVILCSEREPQHCHRSLVAEYLRRHWDGVEIIHV